MAKSDTTKDRFEKALVRSALWKDNVKALYKFLESPVSEERQSVSFGQLIATGSLDRAFEVEAGSPLARAFEATKLDPNDPFAWRLLLSLFAEAHFPKSSKRGRKTEWTDERLCQLLSDFDEIKAARAIKNDTDERTIKGLKARFPRRYQEELSTLRRRLADARNPEKNDVLNEVALAARAIAEEDGIGLDFSTPKLRNLTVRLATDWISSRWRRERKLSR